MPKLTLDGREIEVEAGVTVIEAARTAGIDLRRSAAFSDELTYAPSVRLNVRGREPLGPVEPADRPRLAAEVAAYFRGVRHPDGGPLFAAVHLREEVLDGPHVSAAPDILLEPAEDADGRTPVLCPPQLRSALGDGWHMPVPDAERAGGKGGFLRGSHRPLGILLADFPFSTAAPSPPAGPLDLRDVAPLVHEILDVAEPPWLEKPRRPVARASASDGPPAEPPDGDDGLSAADRRALASRLRALGYIEDDG